MNDRAISMLGLARRAGKLEAGFERCATAINSKKARLALVCSDISPKTKKELAFICDKQKVPYIETSFTLMQLTNAIGFKAGLCVICDDGFAKRLIELLTDNGKDD